METEIIFNGETNKLIFTNRCSNGKIFREEIYARNLIKNTIDYNHEKVKDFIKLLFLAKTIQIPFFDRKILYSILEDYKKNSEIEHINNWIDFQFKHNF